MAVHQLSLETLKNLDGGKVAEAWQQALQRIGADIDDRPGSRSPRRLSLHMDMVPVLDDDGQLSEKSVTFTIEEKVPKRKTRLYPMGIRRGGVLVWNDLSPDNPNQRTIDEMFSAEEESEE